MTERLTKRNSDGSVGINDLRYYNYDDFQKMSKKLAHYEDLEEQGRLVVLPEDFDTTEFLEMIATQPVCPKRFGLKDYDGTEKCDWDVSTCKECWEKALKES